MAASSGHIGRAFRAPASSAVPTRLRSTRPELHEANSNPVLRMLCPFSPSPSSPTSTQGRDLRDSGGFESVLPRMLQGIVHRLPGNAGTGGSPPSNPRARRASAPELTADPGHGTNPVASSRSASPSASSGTGKVRARATVSGRVFSSLARLPGGPRQMRCCRAKISRERSLNNSTR